MHKKAINKLIVLPLIALLLFMGTPINAQLNPYSSSFLVWGSGGYSKITNDAPARKVSGNAGVAIGAGYELHYSNFLFQTGVELSHYASKMSLMDTLLEVPMVDTEGSLFTGLFTFQNTVDVQNITNIGIPLMWGYESPAGFYVAIGGKAMLNLIGRSRTTTEVTSTADYSTIIGDSNDGILSDMPNHGLTTTSRTIKTSTRLHTLFCGSFEAGYTFGLHPESNIVSHKPKVRLSMCCDYGFAPVASGDKTNYLFVNSSNTGEFLPAIRGYLLNDIRSNNLRTLYVGLKVTLLFGIRKNSCNCNWE